MVDRLKLLGNLEEKVSYLMGEMFMFNKKDYEKAAVEVEHALGLMEEVYNKIKDKFPNEPIIKLVEGFYADDWEAHSPPSTYEESLSFGI